MIEPDNEVLEKITCRAANYHIMRQGNFLIDEGGIYPEAKKKEIIRDQHEHGFIAAAILAFDGHATISLRPQHFWLMILQAISTHVGLNAEELRAKWVPHEGKKDLIVIANDFVYGS